VKHTIRTGDTRLSFICPSATVSHTPWIDAKPVSSGPPSDAGSQLSALTDSGVPSLAGRRMCMKDGIAFRRIRPPFVVALNLTIPKKGKRPLSSSIFLLSLRF
jgi:hypothetical protein